MCRWDDNIKMDHIEIWCVDEDCVHLAHDKAQRLAVVNTVTNLLVP
jgi:hypothetical protein